MVKLIVSYTKDIRCSAVGSAWFVSAEELGGSDQGRFSEEKIPPKIWYMYMHINILKICFKSFQIFCTNITKFL